MPYWQMPFNSLRLTVQENRYILVFSSIRQMAIFVFCEYSKTFRLSDDVMCYSWSRSDSILAILAFFVAAWQNDNLLLQPGCAPFTLIIRLILGQHPKFHSLLHFCQTWPTITQIFSACNTRDILRLWICRILIKPSPLCN